MMRTILATTAFLLLAACGGDSAKKSSADPAVVAEAKSVWDTRCVTCHGPQGMGNGVNAKTLKAKPRSFKDGSWQKETTDERIKQVIIEGGGAVGLSVEMAANPDLKDKPAVVDELLAMVRSFAS
jgi:mono/diheme cytochrome c family protein